LDGIERTSATKTTKANAASFKQYRDKDGLFYFKFIDARGELLVQSLGFQSPKEAGHSISAIKTGGLTALDSMAAQLEAIAADKRSTIAAALEELAQL
jgi:tryptophanyl-tRNA synthetase